MIALLSAFAVMSAPAVQAKPADAPPVTLGRVFQKGQRLRYEVKSHLQVQRRQVGLDTYIPEDTDFEYGFTLDVQEMKADGIAVVRYRRPSVTEITGETAERPPQRKVEKTGEDFQLTISPINEVIDFKDLRPPKKEPARPSRNARMLREAAAQDLGSLIGPFIGEIYRLSLFLGSLDSSLDLAPRLPIDELKVGDTWKRTVGYQPQKIKGTNRQAVQRLDYTYTYQGLTTWNNRRVHKVNAALSLNTDLAEFFNQLYQARPDETGLRSIPLRLKANIEFFLDEKTHHTLYAIGTTEGGFRVNLTVLSNDVLQEEQLKGRSTIRLVEMGRTPAERPAPTRRPATRRP